MGSNPTPRASNGDSTKTNKNKRTDLVFRTNNKKEMTLQKSQIQINHSSSSNDIEQLERKIDSITKSLSKPYFNKILKELLKSI